MRTNTALIAELHLFHHHEAAERLAALIHTCKILDDPQADERAKAMHRRAQASEGAEIRLKRVHESYRAEIKHAFASKRFSIRALLTRLHGYAEQLIAAGVPDDWESGGKRREHGQRRPDVLIARLIAERDKLRESVASWKEAWHVQRKATGELAWWVPPLSYLSERQRRFVLARDKNKT